MTIHSFLALLQSLKPDSGIEMTCVSAADDREHVSLTDMHHPEEQAQPGEGVSRVEVV
jgi:hypothetical protein